MKTETGKQETGGASKLRDEKWNTWTCTLGWPVQGIWPEEADGTDVNAVDRSPRSNLLATSDDFGKLKVFNWPCVTRGAQFVEGTGHSSHVTNVRFNTDATNIVTCGGNDRAVFVW